MSQLTIEHDAILSGAVCPYCLRETEYTDSKVIYGKSFGMVYLCAPCGAWVGVHKGTSTALGRLANPELRKWKRCAHEYFDGLWKAKMEDGVDKNDARSAAYQWLSYEMALPLEVTHIGMFDVEQCKKVVSLCKPYYK